MPNTPGGDEPAAPRGAYFTQRDRSAQVPPPRDAGASTYERPPVDPLGQFRERVDVAFEPRQSTPYATHGGEKFNPFESANMSRSKSTRVPSNRYSSNDMPRVGSDSKLNSPPRPHSQETPAGAFKPAFVAPDSDDSSSDDAPKLRTKTPRRAPAFASASQTFANAGNTGSTPPKTGQFSTTMPSMFSQPMADGTNESQKPRKSIPISQFQKMEPSESMPKLPLTYLPSDEPSAATDKSNTKSDNGPSMYDFSFYNSKSYDRKSTFEDKLPTVSGPTLSKSPYSVPPLKPFSTYSGYDCYRKWPNLFPNSDGEKPVTSPSGIAGPNLFPLEETQRSMLDRLINKRHASNTNSTHTPFNGKSGSNADSSKMPAQLNFKAASPAFSQYRESHATLSPSMSQKHLSSPSLKSNGAENSRRFWQEVDQINANNYGRSRFSFKLDPDTFKRTAPSSFRPHSTESINTKFTPEDWHATFEASHFIPEQKTANLAHRPRAQSGSRSRGRSPTKVRPTDSNFTQAQAEPEPPVFPRGAKFSQAEWAGTFKPQTFMQPPVTPIVKPTMAQRPSRRRVPRPTMGTAAVVDDGDTSDEPIFQGRKQSATAAPPATAAPSSPDAMDVDMPPAASASTPAPNANEGMGAKVNSDAPKRAAATSQPPTDTESLKVNFEDLKIQDLISNMDLPTPPVAPQIPAALLPPTKETYSAYEEKFKTYMREWDLFSTRMMLHLVARKNQNDTLGASRWMNGEGIKFYRKGLQEDIAVLQWWDGACQQHGENMKQHQVLMEGMTETEERPRKKTTH